MTSPRFPRRDDAFEELQEALAVTPSGEFVARVRERVRHEPVRVSVGWWIRLGGGVLVTASVVVAVLWIGRAERAPSVAGIGMMASLAPPAPAAAATASVVAPRTAPVTSRVVAGRSAPVTRPLPPVATRAVSRARVAEVLVPDDERLALNRLLIGIRQGRAVVPAAGDRALEDDEGHLLEPRPIEIPLLKAIELLPGTPAGGSGSRVK